MDGEFIFLDGGTSRVERFGYRRQVAQVDKGRQVRAEPATEPHRRPTQTRTYLFSTLVACRKTGKKRSGRPWATSESCWRFVCVLAGATRTLRPAITLQQQTETVDADCPQIVQVRTASLILAKELLVALRVNPVEFNFAALRLRHSHNVVGRPFENVYAGNGPRRQTVVGTPYQFGFLSAHRRPFPRSETFLGGWNQVGLRDCTDGLVR